MVWLSLKEDLVWLFMADKCDGCYLVMWRGRLWCLSDGWFDEEGCGMSVFGGVRWLSL